METEYKKPDCTEMVRYLINSDGYGDKSRKELENDKLLVIVSSACGMDLESVIKLVETLAIEKKHRRF